VYFEFTIGFEISSYFFSNYQSARVLCVLAVTGYFRRNTRVENIRNIIGVVSRCT